MAEIQSQKWARLAYVHMQTPARVAKKDKMEKYGGLWMRLPYLVLTNGLSQAVAFIASKYDEQKKPEFGWVLSDLAAILGYTQNTVQTEIQSFPDTRKYALATRQVLDASIWYKRYAEGIYGLDPTNDAARGDR
ncbi:MAG: type III-B CRISPR module-associated protein Cmr5 [Deltaproteobacteria bacterium]|nr:type III-B CRISPR module-associated protein Cmr5 [Deltaproteobacteria bacterium]